MNAPSSQPVERRGATAPPSGIHSLLFFGGIVLAVGLVAAGALAIWGPEKDVETRTNRLATSAALADSAAALASAEPPAPAVLPEMAPAPVEAPSAEPPAKSKKRGGRPPGSKKH